MALMTWRQSATSAPGLAQLAASHTQRLLRKSRGLCFLVVLLNLSLPSLADGQTSKEYQIKAVLLMNLARFAEWPPDAFSGPDDPIVIGVVGRDPFGRALDEAVKGEQVNGRRIVVRRYPNPRQIKPCQILFISQSERGRIRTILAEENTKPILTVSELNGFTAQDGGMVLLYLNRENKVRLRVNLDAVQAHGLKLSAKLLQVAEVMRRPRP
jgi:YfiR/HmsC-like